MSGARRPGPQALAAAALAAIVLATFSGALSSSRVFFERDIASYWYPHRAALRAALAEGSVPLWNPWIGFGAPFLADGSSSQLAYPPTWLLLGLPLALQFKVLAIGHCLLAAFGAAALARRLGGTALAGAVAGGAYALSGPMLSALGLYHHFAGAAIMPWTLWALEGLLQRASVGRAVVLGLVAAVEVLAGSGDLVLMTALLGLGRLALHATGARGPGLGALARTLALAAALAASVSAVQWLPTVERGVSGLRASQDLRTRSYWSLHPASLADLLVPRLVSEASLPVAERQRLFEGREPLLSCLYLGVVTLVLGALAVTLREPRAAPLAGGAALFVVLALGRHAPLYALLVDLPGFSLMRYPQKHLLPAALCLALLAAAGTGALARRWTEPERRRARVLALVLLAVALGLAAAAARQPAGPDGALAISKLARSAVLLAIAALPLLRRPEGAAVRPPAAAMLLALGALDLVLVGRGTNDLAPEALYAQRPAALELLAGAPRLHAASESAACLAPGRGPAGWRPSWVAALGFLDTLRPPSGIRFGLFGSYDGEFTGLGPRFAAAFTEVVRADLARPEALRLLQLGSVDRVACLGGVVPAGLEPIATLETPLACPLQLLAVPAALPRAYVASVERPEGRDALAAVLDPGFDARHQVVLPEARRTDAAGPAAGEARIVARSANSLELAASLEAPGVLVVTEAFDEGWTAEVDGRAAEVLRANGLFRAVRLAAGSHQVSFRYRPWPVVAGAWASATGLVAAGALWLAGRPRARV